MSEFIILDDNNEASGLDQPRVETQIDLTHVPQSQNYAQPDMRADEGGTFAFNDNNEELSIVGGNTFEDMSELN